MRGAEPEDTRVRALIDRLGRRGLAVAERAFCGVDDQPSREELPAGQVWVGREAAVDRDWIGRDTTADQQRIEEFLAHAPIANRRLLHIGVGNSSLARRFGGAVAEIVGITLSATERRLAAELALPNYKVFVLNKYSRRLRTVGGKFDLIIDNNPASFACCWQHFCRMLIIYKELLGKGGEIVTGQPGLGDVPDWTLGWEDWETLAQALGLHAHVIDAYVYSMSRSAAGSLLQPKATPSPASRSRRKRIESMPGVPILVYHSVAASGPPELAPYRVSPVAFEQQMRWLREQGYRSISLAEWAACIRDGTAPAGRPVVITFDDGYRDFTTNAWPILAQAGFRATVFAVTGRVGAGADWDGLTNPPPLLGWDELRQLEQDGNRVESHGAAHRDFTALSDAELAADAAEARAVLRRELGHEAGAIAYPFGRTDPRVQRVLAASGYRVGVGVTGGHSTGADDPMLLSRIEIFGDDDPAAFARKLAGVDREADGRGTAGGGFLAEQANAASSSSTTPEPAMALPDLPALMARLGRLIDELTEVRAALLAAVEPPPVPAAISGTDILHGQLLGLFDGPPTGEARTLAPYEEISHGVRIGFDADAQVQLTIAPKTDPSVSPEACRNTLRIAFTGIQWFSIELALAPSDIANASRYQLTLSAQLNRPAVCRVSLRRIGADTHHDTPLQAFHLQRSERTYNLSGDLPQPGSPDEPRAAVLFILVFEASPDLALELYYMNLYFA